MKSQPETEVPNGNKAFIKYLEKRLPIEEDSITKQAIENLLHSLNGKGE